MNVPTAKANLEMIDRWGKNVFLFAEEALNMKASEPIDELRGKPITYKDAYGEERTTILFDINGRLVYHDLSFYTVDMFKWQDKQFRKYKGARFTWQQTIELEAYQRAINTFGKDNFEIAKRWITIRSGHGVGKTSFISVVSLHFLLCFFGSQIGVTANTEDQLKDIFLKELSKWKTKLPEWLAQNIEILDDFVRVDKQKDWFLRARVARPEKPEALAGLHADYVLNIADEASGVSDRVFEVMKGALTGENYVVIYTSNPTRNEGEFYESHKAGSQYTKLKFSSRHSPIVKEGYIEKMIEDYGADSDEVKIRVDGDFAGEAEMDEKGWIPLFANVSILFEPASGQVINRGLIAVDPSGKGRDSSIAGIRDNIYLKEVLNERTSMEKDLARKIETIRDAYNCSTSDIAVDAFGIGAKVVVEIRPRADELHSTPVALLVDKAREETKHLYKNYNAELAWKLREWIRQGGIIITNNQKEWLREFGKIKYRRDGQGRIELMPKDMFKQLNGFSPDRFDMAKMTFFKEEPTRPVILSPKQLEGKETIEFLRRAQQTTQVDDSFSSM